MGKIAMVFPGQGAQYVGMLKELYERSEIVRRTFEEADEALGFSIRSLCFDGPEEKLKRTFYTQPAILTASVAVYRLLREHGVAPTLAAGHSLGEYSALVAAEALSFSDAVRLVHRRGQFMDEAVPAGTGAMAAVLGGERAVIESVCREISDRWGTVELANVNCPGQVVLSGLAEAVEKASEEVLRRGARRAVPLVVSGPFHSSLMAPAAERLAAELDTVEIRDARIPVIANATAEPVTTAEAIRQALIRQVASSVLWEDSVRRMVAMGTHVFVEAGPGTVLSGLIKKTDRQATTVHVEDAASLDEALTVLKE
jgi:[acyl-carrier-protein] S-malonyltransferase